MAKAETIKGSDGRTYRKLADGKLGEVVDPAAFAKRQLSGITGKHTITGVRLVDSERPDEPAVVVTMTPAEAKPVVAAVKEVLAKRSGA